MTTHPLHYALALGLAAPMVLLLACGDDSSNTGTSCAVAGDCYPGVDGLAGTAECLDKAAQGYCTHTCATDADCCAADGECPDGRPQVCAPFESTGQMYCFLSCEGADLQGEDPDTYCQDYAASDFGCRSTGGGADNRKVCFPPG